jgi:hypothetical protein
MTHLFKIALEHSDMFIRGLDIDNQLIEYQIVDKLSGKPMEPIKKDKFFVNQDQIVFDKNRTLHIELVSRINQTLNS